MNRAIWEKHAFVKRKSADTYCSLSGEKIAAPEHVVTILGGLSGNLIVSLGHVDRFARLCRDVSAGEFESADEFDMVDAGPARKFDRKSECAICYAADSCNSGLILRRNHDSPIPFFICEDCAGELGERLGDVWERSDELAAELI